MTRDEFLARCGNAYDAGLLTPDRIRLLDRWLDFVLRFEGDLGGQNNQKRWTEDFIEDERRRLDGFRRTLASDTDGYALIQFAAILRHPCQLCAVDPEAWWTRAAFCSHRKASA